jgi:hypothetical protein
VPAEVSRLAIFSISGDDIFSILFVAAVFAVLFRALAWNYLKRLLAGGWATSQGTVELGSVEEHRTRYGRYYIARIDYSYSVNGEYYSGDFQRLFFRESSADRFVGNLKGQMVFVRSNPNHPDRSALLKEDQPGGWPV